LSKSTRKNVTWRVGELSETESVNKWIDAQSNIQNTLTSLALHMIDRFGYRNITDHDIQKIMYQELLTGSIVASLPSAAPIDAEDMKEEQKATNKAHLAAEIEFPQKPQSNIETQTSDTQENEKSDADDIFSQVDQNNL